MDQQTKEGRTEEANSFPILALLDTGSLAGDFISQQVVDKLNAKLKLVSVNTTICSGFNNQCSNKFESITIHLSYINEVTLKQTTISLNALVLPNSPIDLIIGRASLKVHNFLFNTPSHFSTENSIRHEIDSDEPYNTAVIPPRLTNVMRGWPVQPLLVDAPGGESLDPLRESNSTRKPPTSKSSDMREEALRPNSKELDVDNQISSDISRCSCCAIPQGYPAVVGSRPSEPVVALLTKENEGTSVKPTVTVQDQERGRRYKTNWVLQLDGSYNPVRSEIPGPLSCILNLAIPASEEKGNVVMQTWGVIAAFSRGVDHSEVPPPIYTSSNVDPLFREDIGSSFDYSQQDINIEHPSDDIYVDHDVFEPWLQQEDDSSVGHSDPTSLITIEGSPELQSKIKNLLLKYKHIFSNELSDEPARIPEFELVVDRDQWETHNNRGPPRVQSPEKEAEIFRQVDELLKKGIVEPSNSSHYSQVILASKPDKTWRFCIDYRKLNDCTKSPSWPIPNIKSMFSRLGTQGSDTFGVMDLTSGYHQAPVSLLTRAFLAFICFCGIYQFTRLPFGPKRAPSYFQEMMASVVLHGLIYKICEMYLDDCIVHAKGETEFLIRLEEVFKRFQKYNIFLKASKCKFGMAKVDYCGKVISEQGLSMTTSKTETALNFPKPTTHGALKKFVGLANYFHDFVAHHSHIMKPLHDMLENYSKKARTKLLIWTPEGNQAWDLILIEIGKNHTMYFPDDSGPIFLMTDASDYGIGAYCFQKVDNKEQPVAFVSKSLSKSQLNWAIIQKEAYAIFYSLQQLSSILRDRPFTVLTDHRNLLYIQNHSNPMIYRWWVSIQEFDFILKDILGKDNEVADGFSRLVKNEMTDKQLLISAMLIATPMSQDVFNMISSVHNSVNGHHGVDRTIMCLSRIPDSKQIKNLRAYVHLFIKKCPFCQKIDMIKYPIHASPFTTSTYYPMECLNIDFIGPFHDKRYILVIVDAFSRWVELYLCSTATASESARCLFEHFGRYGAPRLIRSDRGSHFANATIAEFLSLVGTEQCLTLAYSSQQNAIVERVNKEINRHIKAWIYDANNLENYHLAIPIVQRILNSAYSDRTGITPASLLFGNSLDLDRGIFLPLSERPSSDIPLSTTMSNMLAFQDKIMTTARSVLMETDKLHMGKLQGQSITVFPPDSFVLVKYRKGSPPSRVHTNWRGPMRVISNDKSIHTLYDLITHKSVRYHAYDIKPFLFDPRRVDPLDVARHDYLEFFVEGILSMKGNPKRVRSLTFLIKWVGYDEAHNSWEPWENLRDLDLLHKYLRDNGLQKIIPFKFKTINA